MIIKINKELIQKIIKKWNAGNCHKLATIEKSPAMIGEAIITGFCNQSNRIIFEGYENRKGEVFTEVNLFGLAVEKAIKVLNHYKKGQFLQVLKGGR